MEEVCATKNHDGGDVSDQGAKVIGTGKDNGRTITITEQRETIQVDGEDNSGEEGRKIDKRTWARVVTGREEV